MTRYYDDQALTLNEILDLMDTLQKTIGASMTGWATLRAVLDWGGRHELFTMAEAAPVVHVDAAPMTQHAMDLKMADFRAAMKRGEVPRSALHRMAARYGPTPDTGRDLPGDRPAGTPAAPPPEPAEGPLPPDDARVTQGGADGTEPAPDAPVPPVAGGGISPFLAPQWTEDEDARLLAMKAKGLTAAEIAGTLGRRVCAVNTRWNKVLKPRLAQARAEIAGAAEETGHSQAAAAPTPAPAPAKARVVPPPAAPAEVPTPPAIIRRELNALGYKRPWTPGLDLKLALDVTGGASIAEIAADLGFDSRVVKDRWQALSGIGLGMRQVLIEVLRERAGPTAEAAE